ncbi:MAG: beta-galactosidase [Planctomycetota bacterium]
MPTVTYDAQSLSIDSKRIWIVGGAIHYARVPRELWADRIRAAKIAGLNTIETPVVWSRHEPRPGQFDFKGDNDLRYFVELIGEAGLLCVLRPGPFVGSGYDFGGLPSWIRHVDGVSLRSANQPFLEASGRYLGAVAEQIKDLQATSPRGGPIVLVQNEHQWTCGDRDAAQGYLGELSRYLRESGITVPNMNANNLWESVEGEIEAWAGRDEMLATVRQLGYVNPKSPRIVADLRAGHADAWGYPSGTESGAVLTPRQLTRTLAEVLAGAGQFIVNPFHGGTNFAAAAGRSPQEEAAFLTASNDQGAPLSEAGDAGTSFTALRAVATFASTFARVFSSLDADDRQIGLDPAGGSTSVVHVRGTQGGVAFVFAPEADGKRKTAEPYGLLLADGSRLEVPVGLFGVAWCLIGSHLVGRSFLDYCGLSVVGLAGRAMLCFGPEGSVASVSINGSPIDVEVPKSKAKTPSVIEHEGVILVVCNEAQLETTFLGEDAVFFHVLGLTEDGLAIPATTKKPMKVGQDAAVVAADAAPRTPAAKATLDNWEMASTEDYTSGSSPRYAAIGGPADLTSLGAPYDYGWYRLTMKSSAAKKSKYAIPEGADRLHLFVDGEATELIGEAPGAVLDGVLSLGKGEQQVVVLADNMGRFATGSRIGEAKGLAGHLWEVAPFKAGRSKTVDGDPVELLSFRKPMWEARPGDATHPQRLTWSFVHRKKSPIIVRFGPFVGRALVILNDEPIHELDRGGRDRLVLDQETLNRGNNTLQIAVSAEVCLEEEVGGVLSEIAAGIEFLEGVNCLTEKAGWAFAKWEPPAPTAYEPVAKSALGSRSGPAWWRCRFATPETTRPMYVELSGMTKGRLYVNGNDAGRYFVATADGTEVPPQTRWYVPSTWLSTERENELVLFDEHGGNPGKIKLAYGEPPVGTA